LETAKVQIVAQIIKVATFGLDVLVESIFAAFRCGYDSASTNFALYAIELICTRISSEEYGFQPLAFTLRTANWDNLKKAIFRCCARGVWSNGYVKRLVNHSRVKRTDSDIVRGVFAPVAIYCTKLIPEFDAHLNGKRHHMLRTEYSRGDAWNRLVGDPL
jgi:hypothetical protein